MANVIWKYDITNLGFTDLYLYLPAGAKVLSAANQNERVCLWVMVDNTLPAIEPRRFSLFPTGSIVPPFKEFVGTVLLGQGSVVLHVFELPL